MMPTTTMEDTAPAEEQNLDYKALGDAFCFHPRFKTTRAGVGECWDGTEWCSEQLLFCAEIDSDAGPYTKLVLHSTRATSRMMMGLGSFFAKLRYGPKARIAFVVTGGRGQWAVVTKHPQ